MHLSYSRVSNQWLSVLGCENDVIKEMRVGRWHGGLSLAPLPGCGSFEILFPGLPALQPEVSLCSTTGYKL